MLATDTRTQNTFYDRGQLVQYMNGNQVHCTSPLMLHIPARQ